MGQPHKHAELIKAWADNPQLEFQFRGAGCQSSCWFNLSKTQPDWTAPEIRIKPKTIKYRNYLWKSAHSSSDEILVSICNYTENMNDPREQRNGFVKWVGYWQEVEV